MFVRKKNQVQKSFRIDEDVERDLGLLSKLTERSQNDLANVALEELLQDNKLYFLKVSILEHFRMEMEGTEETFKPFELGGIKVELEYLDENRVKVTYSSEYEETFSKEFPSDFGKELDEYLISLATGINIDADDTKQYLKNRTDYADYIKIRNN